MIEVRITLDEINYDELAEYLIPFIAEKMEKKGGFAALMGSKPGAMTVMAQQMLKTMSQKKKDELVLKMLTEYKSTVIEKLNDSVKKYVAGVNIGDVAAYRLPEENK